MTEVVRFRSNRIWIVIFSLVAAGIGMPSGIVAAPAGATDAMKEQNRQVALEEDVTQGALRIVGDDGQVVECPLRHTDVKANVSGFIARVKVTQTFYNPTDERIEAVYVFPLPHEAAVDDMTMVIGKRKIVGLIKRRAEARRIYDQALAAGQTAALLEQERPNIFTQSVGNIDPGQDVNIEISYVDVLDYDMGTYEFHFPMVVGPRFIPGAPVSDPQPTPPELQGKVSPPIPDTTRVPDASRISPPVLKPGHRNGHNISLSLRLDAGVPIQGLKVANHEADVVREGKDRAEVTLSLADSIPNKDFVLRYHVVGKKPEMAVLGHTGDYTDARRLGRGYFMLMIQPTEDERLTKSPPREIVFLLDVSGSMRGQKTEKVKEAMRDMLKLCREIDTMQVITFASRTQQLFEKPVPVNKQNVSMALNFTQGVRGSGGTHMLEGVKRAIDQPIDKERVRIVIMLTDGFIGNEAEIIEHVGKKCGDQIRFWAIGIGSSPNMFLVDGVARQGGGMGKRLGLNDIAAGLAEEVITRIQRAQLAKIKIDWGSLNVAETYPAKIPELWAGRPVILFGRYTGGGAAKIKVNGVVEGEPVSWPLQVALPKNKPHHDVLAKVWSRKKIEDLMQQTYYIGSPAVEEEVTAIALDYRLMSQYTSFVAVDETDAEEIANERPAQPPRRMLVPVPLPEGAKWEGFFGERTLKTDVLARMEAIAPARLAFRAAPAASSADRSVRRNSIHSPTPAPAAVPARPNSSAPLGWARPAGPVRFQAGKSPLSQAAMAPYGAMMGRGGMGGGMAPMGGYGYAGSHQMATRSRGVSRGQLSLLARIPAAESRSAPTEVGYTLYALRNTANELPPAAQKALLDGQAMQKQGKLNAARKALERACLLDTAALNCTGNGGKIAREALAALEAIHNKQTKARTEQMPALATRLDVVIRDKSIAESLRAVASAAGMKVELLPGAIDDARALLQREPRVSYLDLRRATVGQALDWILHPARLTWWPAAGKIVAGSQRRGSAPSGWVYDVSSIALPTTKELADLKDQQKAMAAARKAADEFAKTARRTLKTDDELSVAWFAPGQLLIFGDADTHAAAARLFADLADPRHEPGADIAELHRITSRRVQENQEAISVSQARRQLSDVAAKHHAFGWQLLAAAADGRLDLEALTELQIAWQRPETGQLLDEQGAAVALRSLWILAEASRALPDERELKALAAHARKQSRAAADKALSTLEGKPQDEAACVATMYARLAFRDSGQFSDRALRAMSASGATDSAPGRTRIAVQALLANPGKIERQALVELAGTVASGEDAAVLTALACRRAGGEVWDAFRAGSKDMLGKQPLPGSIVVLIGRLAGSSLPLVAAR